MRTFFCLLYNFCLVVTSTAVVEIIVKSPTGWNGRVSRNSENLMFVRVHHSLSFSCDLFDSFPDGSSIPSKRLVAPIPGRFWNQETQPSEPIVRPLQVEQHFQNGRRITMRSSFMIQQHSRTNISWHAVLLAALNSEIGLNRSEANGIRNVSVGNKSNRELSYASTAIIKEERTRTSALVQSDRIE